MKRAARQHWSRCEKKKAREKVPKALKGGKPPMRVSRYSTQARTEKVTRPEGGKAKGETANGSQPFLTYTHAEYGTVPWRR